MQKAIKKFHNPDLGIFCVRLGLAAVFVVHGWQKLANLGATVGFFGQIGVPSVFAYAVAIVEFFGGLALLFGLFVEWAGFLLAIVMAFAIYLVKYPRGFLGGYEFDLMLLLAALAAMFLGAGRYTIKTLAKKK